MQVLSATYWKSRYSESVHIAPLAMFRVIFGTVMLLAVLRFMWNGWVYDLYIKPTFYFPYYGFEWIKPLGGQGMYIVFAIMALSYLCVALGYFYRIAILTAFLTFTYVELIDKANYLNHYYFVSIVSFIMIFLPAASYFSLDVRRKSSLQLSRIPRWMISVLKLQLAIVYIYAGIAKLNYDWLFRAMPLKIWLPAHADMPLIGGFLEEEWIAYFFSWFGAVYDLFIVFFLLNKRTRLAAYAFVIAFHVLTKILFPIGMFPYVMILSTLIFFSEDFHKKIIATLSRIQLFNRNSPQEIPSSSLQYSFRTKLVLCMIALFFIVQIALPWRFVFYPGKLFWTEQGFRFSWRVMLMEKAGTAFFYVKDAKTGRECEVMNDEYLTKNQEKMMATQPDMILQYAHFLKKEYERKGLQNPQVRVESHVTLNGSGSRPFLDSRVNLAGEQENFLPKKWILPFKE
ncbi:MAG: HTTM domain-containing protein [Flavobacteriales bacterium]